MKSPLQLEKASLTCAINGEQLEDPAVDHEDNSYEKSAILKWLSRIPTSPITRNPLRVDQLAPNCVLKALLFEDREDYILVSKDLQAPPIASSPTVQTSTRIITAGNDEHALIQVLVTDDSSTSQQPASAVCVLGVSYSMGFPATMHGDS